MEKLEEKLKHFNYDLTNKQVVVFGAGHTSMLNQDVLLNENLNIKFFCDNSKEKIGKTFLGYPVISFKEMLSLDNLFVIVCAGTVKATRQISSDLDKCNIKNCTLHRYILNKYRNEVIEAYKLMETQADKDIYNTIINSRLEMNRYPIEICNSSINQYFDNKNINYYYNLDNYVDLGAYVGDTIEKYITLSSGVFNKIYAFEPNKNNYQAMIQRIQRIKNEWHLKDEQFILENAGIDQTSSIKMFQDTNKIKENGFSAQFINDTEDGICIPTFCINDFFKNKQISFLKADIESYETKMLKGAEKVIRRDNPALAICAYHTAKDIFTIPLLIKEIEKEYNFNLKYYSNNEAETVVYAYTKKRK